MPTIHYSPLTIDYSLLTIHHYIRRCLQLAKFGAGKVAPNPMVGAVLVYEDRIIGEGWHRQYGEAHAEVNCIASVSEADRQFITKSVLYVSLEPCAHFGKTPPCADLVIREQIPRVVIGCRDPFKEVDGKGIEKLRAANVVVELVGHPLEEECKELNRRFFTFHQQKRPYIILKWAETADGFMAANTTANRLLISNEYSNRLVHRWRSEEAAILVGTNTALSDDSALTTRLWSGMSPVRLVLDLDLKLPASLRLFDRQVKTIVFNTVKNEEQENLVYYRLGKDKNIIAQMLDALYAMNIQSVLVEGGARLLQSFIDEQLWDEARIISNEELFIGNGLKAPVLPATEKAGEQKLLTDHIVFYRNSNSHLSPGPLS